MVRDGRGGDLAVSKRRAQINVLALIASGKTAKAAAIESGRTEQTYYTWLKEDAGFAARVTAE